MDKLFKEYKHPTRKSDNVRKEPHIVRNTVLLGDWEEVRGINAQTLKPDLKAENLDGLIIKGYEMRWDETNRNLERYDKTAFDDFIKDYFVASGLNMPVDIDHQGDLDWRNYCGRVLYIETNSVGFYYVVYVPRTYADYDRLMWALKNGIIQGFSKYGFVDWDDYEPVFDNNTGKFLYEQIHKMRVVRMSLVTTPANGIPFERMQQTQNALIFYNRNEKRGKSLAELFQK